MMKYEYDTLDAGGNWDMPPGEVWAEIEKLIRSGGVVAIFEKDEFDLAGFERIDLDEVKI